MRKRGKEKQREKGRANIFYITSYIHFFHFVSFSNYYLKTRIQALVQALEYAEVREKSIRLDDSAKLALKHCVRAHSPR